MKKAIWIGVGVAVGYYLVSRSKTEPMKNTELIVQMIKKGASVEELNEVGNLIKKYCPDI